MHHYLRHHTLVAGQRQRIAIARAILKNPRIFILDEASSALDAESEAKIMESLSLLSKGRTVLTIAHRLSTMKHADLVAVLACGRIVEAGTFADLARNPNSQFRALIDKQLVGVSLDSIV